MINALTNKKIVVGERYKSPFNWDVNIYQDGTVPFCRDKNGKLWAMAGHTNGGIVGMFCGSNLSDMKLEHPALFNFCMGHAEYAFNGIKYPEGVKARGGLWPFGLYICPKTNRFFAFFHNESGWKGCGTAYDSYGPCETPRIDSDFRHIGLIHSDDEGKHWTFDRWVLTAESVCFTDKYNPDGINVLGQKSGKVCLGSGDFSLYIPQKSDYIYLFYSMITIDTESKKWLSCDAYVARARKRFDGIAGDFVKYYDGAFCEAGNFGKESVIVKDCWHPRVAYSELLGKYIMASSPINVNSDKNFVKDILELRTSDNLLKWSEPLTVKAGEKPFGAHYQAPVSFNAEGDPYVIKGNKFTVLTDDKAQGTGDVYCNDFTLE